jgi:potassium efflux system protein
MINKPASTALLFALLIFHTATLIAADNAGTSPADSHTLPTPEMLQNRADDAAVSTSLDDATKTTLAELYRATTGNLELAADHRAAAQRYTQAIAGSAEQIAEVEAQRDEAARVAAEPIGDPTDLALPEIEQQLQTAKADVAVAAAHFTELESRFNAEKDRPAAIRQRLAAAETELNQLPSTTAPPSTDSANEIAEARRWAEQSRRELLRAERLMLEQELSTQPTRLRLIEAQRDLAETRLAQLQHRVDRLERMANDVRLAAAESARVEAIEAEREAASKHQVVAELAAHNTRLSEEIDRLAKEIDTIDNAEAKAADEAKRIEESFQSTREKLEIAGLSQVLGQVLQQEKRALPNTGQFEKQARERERKIAETSLSQIQLREERRRLRQMDVYVANLAATVPDAQRPQIVAELETLALSRKQLIDNALSVQRAYLLAMGELDVSQRRLQQAVARYDDFLDKRLLWIRSTEVVSLDTVRHIPAQLAKLADPAEWRRLAETLVRDVLPMPLFILALALVLIVRALHHKLWRMLLDSAQHVGNLLRDNLQDTLRAIGLIVVLALPWPLLMLVVSWELRTAFDASNFVRLFGNALWLLAPLLFHLRAFSLFVAPGSVASAHFGWREQGVKQLHHDLAWFTPLVITVAFPTTLALTYLELGSGSGLGRGLFVLLMGVFALFFYRLAKPGGGTIAVLASGDTRGSVYRLRHLWFMLLVGAPIASALVSLAGYMYTAGTLIDRILQSGWFILLVVVIHQLILRWLTLNQRRLRLEAARAKRKAEQEARAAKDTESDLEGFGAREVEEPVIDLKALDATSRKLLNNTVLLAGLVGLWAIWREVLPALGILNDITLWTYTRSGAEDLVPITLSSLGLALLVIVVTVIATRQLPAFLEIVLLQRLNMNQGSRYTVTTLTRYTVVAVGLAWTFGFLGGSWSEIQWIFAALGVGIGFGLQEIVANFISGLIILFERPIRVGDVVTVGNTDGVVTRIQIRATTIRNWDRKELLVPNKNFITQELLNWSLSDQTTRILLRVGVAYGSDAQRALLILEEVATDHPRIMQDPQPFCVFEDFGNDALLLSLRCYIDDIDYRMRTITELNLAIYERFSDAGIEIAFPQRDVHLDTNGPIDIRLQRAPAKQDDAG